MRYEYRVLARWGHLYPDLHLSGQQIYTDVEERLKARAIVGAQISRFEWKEGGLFSAQREYLRIRRGEHAIDICAAPFGSGFFFSSWLTEPQPRVGLVALFLLAVAFLFLSGVFFQSRIWWHLGFLANFKGTLYLLTVAGALWGLFTAARNGVFSEDFIRGVPGIGWLYDRLFRPATFYRIDTAIMFHEAVHGSLLEVVDAVTGEKGIPRLSDLERRPEHRDLTRLR
ncbi:MAG TPA: hypothetical protein VHL58_06930 [Thermoanaerobaculia bacterium]|nr:hypothetical protein [Thermoanaerobaculia bacterium]